jgi:hypothetical protein
MTGNEMRLREIRSRSEETEIKRILWNIERLRGTDLQDSS